MRLLVLGGTRFLGRCIVAAALARGHRVTLFNRGKYAPDLFPDAERLFGDRNGDLAQLVGRRWDTVIDTCGHLPQVVRRSTNLLANHIGHYTFISSISVYRTFTSGTVDESAAIEPAGSEDVAEVTPETFAVVKATCEAVVQRTMGANALIVRPGLIVGPHDPLDRLAYWVRRLVSFDEVLAPGDPEGPVQVLDVRDLADWILTMSDTATTGTFNAVGPSASTTWGQLLLECRAATGSSAKLTWVDESFLLDLGVTPMADLPLWVPKQDEDFYRVQADKAYRAGLQPRPIGETARDTLVWTERDERDVEIEQGLPRVRERELLTAWHMRGPS